LVRQLRAFPVEADGSCDNSAVDDLDAVVAFLLTAGEGERSEWGQSQPAEPNWWLALLEAVEHRRRDADADNHCVIGLHLWLLRAAARAHALTVEETAIRTALLVARLRPTARAGTADKDLPSSDAVTAQCLALLPSSPDHLPGRDELLLRLAAKDEAALEAARRSRRAKNLVNAAATHAGHLRDPGLQAQLQRWIDALPRLV
jgi:hypothetical protein